jgi:hypothetical protein
VLATRNFSSQTSGRRVQRMRGNKNGAIRLERPRSKRTCAAELEFVSAGISIMYVNLPQAQLPCRCRAELMA